MMEQLQGVEEAPQTPSLNNLYNKYNEQKEKKEQIAAFIDFLQTSYPDKRLHFLLHEPTDRVVIQVLDAESGEVLRQIPEEEMLQMIEAIHKILGLLVDEEA
jgi:flagellar protein FlaG